MQNSPDFDKLFHLSFTLNSFVLHRKFRVVQIWDKLKPLRNGAVNFINKNTEVTHELLK